MPGIKVFKRDPKHDEKVMDAVARAQAEINDRNLEAGIFVIDYADATISGISMRVPRGDLHILNQSGENSLLSGGFGAAVEYPWSEPWKPGPSAADAMQEVFSDSEIAALKEDTAELKGMRDGDG